MRKYILSLTMMAAAMIAFAGNMRVSLLTCGPGSEVFELEGHTGLRFTDPSTGLDVVVHWGLFDFNSPNFLYRFVKGETDYSVGEMPAEYFLYAYRADGRRVTEQTLNLTDSEVAALYCLVAENLKPGNRVYRYNYVKDNCATRPLSMLERALGDSIVFHADSVPATFRSEMTRFHSDYPWYQFGIDLALGSGIDYRISSREKIFAPVTLEEMMETATVGDRRLVGSTTQLVSERQGGISPGPTPWYLTPVAVSVIVLLAALGITVRDIRRRRVTRWFDALIYSAFGIAGLVLTFLIFVSTHEATSPNWLYLWLNPLCLVVPLLIWLKKYNRVVFYWQIVNFVALIALLIVACFGVQVMNSAFILLILCDMVRSANYIYLNRCEKKKIG